MRIPRIYTSQTLTPGAQLELRDQAAHYLLKVLRMESGRELVLFNGDGAEYPAGIESTGKKHLVCTVHERVETDRESPLTTELAIGISRGERMDWVLQKATELGVSRIVPLFAERTEVKLKGERLEKKQQHWQQVIISACEQCTRNTLPELLPPLTLADYLNNCDSELKFVLHHRTERALSGLNKPSSVALLVGPEGGLSEEEITQAQTQSFMPLSLGPRVLRTETAPVAALSVLQFAWGDF